MKAVAIGSIIPGATMAARMQAMGYGATTWAGGADYYLPAGTQVSQGSVSAMAAATGTWLFPVPDVTGTPRVWVNDAGQIVSKSFTGPYGEELGIFTEPGYSSIGFAGYISGPCLEGLSYTPNRYLSNLTGRFMSVDPSNSFNLHDPRTFNQYAYVAGNPLLMTDPSGLLMRVVGDQEDNFIGMLSREMGLRAYENDEGYVVREQGRISSDRTALVQAFDEAASSETPEFTIEAVGTSAHVLIDDFTASGNPKVSVTQLGRLPSRPSADRPDEATRGEMLSHILAEYAAGAKAGGFSGGFNGTYLPAHFGPAMKAENAFRLGLGQSRIMSSTTNFINKFYYEYQSGAQEGIYFSGGDISQTRYSNGSLRQWFGSLFW